MSNEDELLWLQAQLKAMLPPLPSGEALATSDGTRYVERCGICGWGVALVANSNLYAEGASAFRIVTLPMASQCPQCRGTDHE